MEKIDEETRLVLRLTAEAQNVALVREAVVARARSFGMTDAQVDDVKTMVSEACANVVLHAYPSDAEERPLEVELTRDRYALGLVVRDEGGGIQPDLTPRRPSLRLGLLLVGALSSCFQLRSGRGQGTELTVRLAFAD